MLLPQPTDDGSYTLYVTELDEHYHSTHGAYTEAMHVYINTAFNRCTKPEVSVLEIGFGTGLNALLTRRETLRRGIIARYTSLEKYPLPFELLDSAGHFAGETDDDRTAFEALHRAPWNRMEVIEPQFSLHKIETDLALYRPESLFDVVYFDAFAPEKQPEMWNETHFASLFGALTPGGVLSTYCAKGVVRRTLQAVGFTVERLPGPPGKREILRATKPF